MERVDSQAWMVGRTSIAVFGWWRAADGRVIVRTFVCSGKTSTTPDVERTADFSLLVDMIDNFVRFLDVEERIVCTILGQLIVRGLQDWKT